MSINVFALTAAKVRAHMFPRWPEFTARSSPTDTVVGEIITEQAAELEGKLYTENIAASGITDDATAAYQWCVRTLKLMCALAILSSSTMSDPELSKKYERELKARLDDLEGKRWREVPVEGSIDRLKAKVAEWRASLQGLLEAFDPCI